MSIAATLAGAAAARSQAYWLLSRLLLRPADESLIRELSEFFSAAAGGIGPGLVQQVDAFTASVRGLTGGPLPLNIAVDFTRLFSGHSKKHGLPPVESIIREGRILGEAASAVAISYAQAGFPEPLPEAGPPDHAAAELRFLALCCHAESGAWGARAVDAGARWLRCELDFLEGHVGAWLPAYCDSAALRAAAPLYSTGLRLLSAMLLADSEDVREMLARVFREMAPDQVPSS